MNELPPELVYKLILPNLKWNDLLRLRRVCQRTKSVTDAFIQEKKISVPDRVIIELNNSDKSIEAFLQLGYQATHFYLDNSSNGDKFFTGEAASQFRQRYAPKITHLEVAKFSIYLNGEELSFYKSLQNLKSLEINSVYTKVNYILPAEDLPRPCIPKSLKNLTSLKIKTAKQPCSTNDVYFSFLSTCKKLTKVTPSANEKHYTALASQFLRLSFYLIPRPYPEPLSNLEHLDLKYCPLARNPYDRRASKLSPYFLDLCEQLARNGSKVRNVPARLFNRFNLDEYDFQIVSDVIESLDGLHPIPLQINLPFLRYLSINTHLQPHSFFPAAGTSSFQTIWPALQKIELLVERKNFLRCKRQRQHFPKKPVTELFNLLFGCTVRSNLLVLRIYFYPRLWDTLSSDLTTYPCPRISEILSSCPNLVKLELTNWPNGDNILFSKLWGGLRQLEKVNLTKCKLLGDEGFIGEDENQPAFLQLKRLKRLVLGNLEKMPKITDKSFRKVFRHLKVIHFEISSKKPVENVTVEGIQSLLSGNFSQHVEYFPFTNWSMLHVDKVRFGLLANQFRSSHMM